MNDFAVRIQHRTQIRQLSCGGEGFVDRPRVQPPDPLGNPQRDGCCERFGVLAKHQVPGLQDLLDRSDDGPYFGVGKCCIHSVSSRSSAAASLPHQAAKPPTDSVERASLRLSTRIVGV